MTLEPASRILGTGHFLPPIVRTNADLEKMVDTSDAWIVERTGIRQRHIAPEGMCTSDMATEAAKRALESAEVSAKDLDMILVATVTPDMPMPATAVFVQQKLGAAPCPSLDLSAACAGFIFGLSIADQFIRSGAETSGSAAASFDAFLTISPITSCDAAGCCARTVWPRSIAAPVPTSIASKKEDAVALFILCASIASERGHGQRAKSGGSSQPQVVARPS